MNKLLTSITVVTIVWWGLLLLVSCSSQDHSTEPVPESILVRVADRVITRTDFITRSEYIPRPPYCRGNSNIHKKIILNSLIAEKLLALVADSEHPLLNDPGFQQYLQGRREQAMRQLLYKREGPQRVELDPTEISEMTRLAGRDYQIMYANLPDSSLAGYVSERLELGSALENIFLETGFIDSLPTRDVTWYEQDDPIIHQAFYSHPLKKDEIVGPLRVSDGSYLVAQVLGLTTHVAVTEKQKRERWDMVTKDVTTMRGQLLFQEFVGILMRGREFELHPETFRDYTQFLGRHYLKSNEEKKEILNLALWDDYTEIPAMLDTIPEPMDPQRPLLTLDGEVWTLGDISGLIRTHPLIFRKHQIDGIEFTEQLKFALADLLRDHFLTQEAYRRKLDQTFAIQSHEAQWRDHYVALEDRTRILQERGYSGNFSTGYVTALEEYMNPYIDSLQALYSDQIEINTKMLEEIQLTSVDMVVTHQKAPYPTVVPNFPVFTTDSRLDYGRVMDMSEKKNDSAGSE